ncbi:MAG TPA: HD domain-containing phosphohydrolase [Candidatus Dormibacteraeota bacterium]
MAQAIRSESTSRTARARTAGNGDTGSISGHSRETILIVDDDFQTRDAAERILKRAHYRVIQAATAEEARVAWRDDHPSVMLVDLELGGEPGSALLDEGWVRNLETAVVVVTGSDDVDMASDSFERGASGYLVKPFTPNELLMQVNSASRRRNLERTVANQVRELERKVIESATRIGELRSSLETVTSGSSLGDERLVQHLCSAVSLRDDDTGRHIERVSVTAAALAGWCGFAVDPAPALRLAAALHDVGKIGIPDWVLLKAGRLTPEERTIIERHCELGHALLSGSASPMLILAASVALNHHERWDGNGYPNRKRGDDIPLEARITTVADVFDALTRDRVYRAALPLETAIDVMVRDRGGLFDPKLLDLFLDRLDDVLDLTRALPDPEVARVTRIVIAGDEPVLVEGLLRLMNRKGEMRVIGSGQTWLEVMDAVRNLRPDVLLTDYRLPGGDAASLTEMVIAELPETKVIVRIDMEASGNALRCIAAGCSGVVARTASVDDVAMAIRRVHNGEAVIPIELLPRVLSDLRRTEHRVGDDMTRRERELLGHLERGLSLADIANAMSISTNTARNHTQRVIEKLGAHSKLEAVVIAMREGLVTTAP